MLITIISLTVTIGGYFLARRVCEGLGKPWANPVLFSLLLVVTVLSLLPIEYETYFERTRPVTALLGPATVALAIPLYRQRNTLRDKMVPILAGIVVGSLTSMVVAYGVGTLLGLSMATRLSMIPKSVTIPIGVEISRLIGGDPSLSTVFTVLTAMTGSILGRSLYRKLNADPLSEGLGLGTIAHGLGVAAALEIGRAPGALSAVAMVLAGLFTSILAGLWVLMF